MSNPAPGETWIGKEVLLEEFEAAWNASGTPDVFRFADRCPRDGFGTTVAELIQIDLERRWRHSNPDLRRGLMAYLEVLPHVFTDAELVELICSEYRVRNQWGDCISRRQVWENHAHLGTALMNHIERLSETIDWPTASVEVNGQKILETRLDRAIEAGRQQSEEQKPWTISSTQFLHRINLNEVCDPTLSRKQLMISLHSPHAVLLQNTSSNRAIAIQGLGAIGSGEELVCHLPVVVHLGESRYLRVNE